MSALAFVAKLSSDKAFADKVKACDSADRIIAVAKSNGITLTNADLAKALAATSADLTDEELEGVSSGTVMALALIK